MPWTGIMPGKTDLKRYERIGMHPQQLLEYIIRPTLKKLGHWSESAEQLLLATAAHESHCGEYVQQINGPALGIYQCEPATHRDIWINYLACREDGLIRKVGQFATPYFGIPHDRELITNLAYATAMCRVHYLRVSEPLPKPGDIEGMAEYWGKYYQTQNDPAKKRQFVANWNRYAAPVAA